MPQSALPDRQIKLLNAVARWRGPGLPLAGSLADSLGYADESGVRYNLKQLAQAGYVELVNVHGRSMPRLLDRAKQVVSPPSDAPTEYSVSSGTEWDFGTVQVTCGPLAATVQEPRPLYPCDMFPKFRDGDRVFEAINDSMVSPNGDERSIPPGSLVHVRPGVAPVNGDIVYAEYVLDSGERECTFKLFSLDEHTHMVTLRALNPAYEDIVLPGDRVDVAGIVWNVRVLKGRGK